MHKTTRTAAIITALALSIGVAVPTVAQSDDESPITLGFSIAKTGGFAPYDLASLAGAQMAVNEINEAGGLLGRQLEVIDYDTQTDINQSAPGAQDLLQRGADFMFATADYDFGGPAIREAVNAGKVGVGFAGDPLFGYHGIGPLAFNTHPGSPAEGAVNAEFAASQGWERAYVLTDTINSYPSTITQYFKTRFAELGGEVIGEDLFNQADASIATQITALEAADPDVILVASFPPGGASAVKQIRAAGIDTPILGTAAFDGSSWIGAVPGLSEMYNPKLSSGDGNDPNPATNEFFATFEETTGEEPVIPSYLAAGYVEVMLLAEGIRRAGTVEGTEVAEEMGGLAGIDTILGPYDYAARPECNMPQDFEFKIFRVTNGVEEYVETMAPTVPPVDC